jgi:hypothetical protein
MNAAFKKMFAFREILSLSLYCPAGLGPGHGNVLEAVHAFGNDAFTRKVQSRDEPTTELRDLGKGVSPAAAVHKKTGVPFLIRRVPGSKSHAGFGVPAAASANNWQGS